VGETDIVKVPDDVEVTVSDTVVVSVVEPLAPVTVIAYVPAVTAEPTVMDIVDVPAPVIDVGLNDTVTPEGSREADRLIAESNPPLTALVMVDDPELPCLIETEPGEAERL
jgi:hypothetical protein